MLPLAGGFGKLSLPRSNKKHMDIGKEDFKTKVLDAPGAALVDFWAPWCGPCRMIGPVVEELAKKYEGKAVVVKVNVDDNQELAQEYGVMSIPTMVFFKDGKEVNRTVGASGKEEIEKKIDNLL